MALIRPKKISRNGTITYSWEITSGDTCEPIRIGNVSDLYAFCFPTTRAGKVVISARTENGQWQQLFVDFVDATIISYSSTVFSTELTSLSPISLDGIKYIKVNSTDGTNTIGINYRNQKAVYNG